MRGPGPGGQIEDPLVMLVGESTVVGLLLSEVEYPVVVGWEGVMREYVMVYSWFCMAYAGLLLSLYTCSGGSSQGKLGLKLYSI